MIGKVGELYISSCISSPNFVQVSLGTCHRSIQNCNSSFTLSGGGYLASYSCYHVERYSSWVCYSKNCHYGCFGRPGAKGSAIHVFKPLAAQRHVMHKHKGSVPQSVRQWNGWHECLQEKACCQCLKEWTGWCAQKGIWNNAISAMILTDIFAWFI